MSDFYITIILAFSRCHKMCFFLKKKKYSLFRNIHKSGYYLAQLLVRQREGDQKACENRWVMGLGISLRFDDEQITDMELKLTQVRTDVHDEMKRMNRNQFEETPKSISLLAQSFVCILITISIYDSFICFLKSFCKLFSNIFLRSLEVSDSHLKNITCS